MIMNKLSSARRMDKGQKAKRVFYILHFILINPIYLKRGPICPQDIFYSISLVFRSPVSFPVEYSMQIIHRLQRK